MGRKSKRRRAKAKGKRTIDNNSGGLMDSIIPSPDLIAKELMQHFGGQDLRTRHELELSEKRSMLSGTNTYFHRGDFNDSNHMSREVNAFSSISAPGGNRPNKI